MLASPDLEAEKLDLPMARAKSECIPNAILTPGTRILSD
jgi:hypothetical protein